MKTVSVQIRNVETVGSVVLLRYLRTRRVNGQLVVQVNLQSVPRRHANGRTHRLAGISTQMHGIILARSWVVHREVAIFHVEVNVKLFSAGSCGSKFRRVGERPGLCHCGSNNRCDGGHYENRNNMTIHGERPSGDRVRI